MVRQCVQQWLEAATPTTFPRPTIGSTPINEFTTETSHVASQLYFPALLLHNHLQSQLAITSSM